MSDKGVSIDPYLFSVHFAAFSEFVQARSGMAFDSFTANPYTVHQEGYKYDIYRHAREQLKQQSWTPQMIGRGEIVRAVIAAIELPENNLVPWRSRYGEDKRPHQPLYLALAEDEDGSDNLQKIELLLFQLYHGQDDAGTFAELLEIFGKQYALLAYLFFLKDCARFLPIAPTYFDRVFQYLGAEHTTRARCSWENFQHYLSLIDALRILLSERLGVSVSLLDAHSFAWILVSQMEKQVGLPDTQDYLSLPITEREAVILARVGQGYFRQQLIHYWQRCAVTGCKELGLLQASHIKPWACSNLSERLNPFNGILLSPTLDSCFDRGYISFDDSGQIMISSRLNGSDAAALGIHAEMRLSQLDTRHQTFLSYHRAEIFKG